MQYKIYQGNNVETKLSVFENNNTREVHLMCTPNGDHPFQEQLIQILDNIECVVGKHQLSSDSLIVLRFFVSDCANQFEYIEKLEEQLNKIYGNFALSVVQQPPLSGSKITAWAYFIDNKQGEIQKKYENGCTIVQSESYAHFYHTQLLASKNKCDSYQQTEQIFKQFKDVLNNNQLTIKENCIRTWLYVKDVDYNYEGVVVARRELFEKLGMTPDTHYITSTGIEGRHTNYNNKVLMDAYSIKGIIPEQVKFLTAPEYLNPTHEYGVTFERGTSVDYGDRRHIFLSGTASINNKGEIVHPHDINGQIERTLTNIEALLKDANAGMNDIAHLIIYLRDVGDASVVNEYMQSTYPGIPQTLVLAPVCRPGWLIEMECIAIKKVDNKAYNNF